jgi:hypothetical protein
MALLSYLLCMLGTYQSPIIPQQFFPSLSISHIYIAIQKHFFSIDFLLDLEWIALTIYYDYSVLELGRR